MERTDIESAHQGIFATIGSTDHEQVVFCNDTRLGLKAIIAIHNTTLGPAIGGVRMLDYATEAEALDDVLRLSRGMTYKNSLAGVNLGGGKAVIIGDPNVLRTEAVLRRFGSFIQTLQGHYYTAEDVNISVREVGYINMETPYVVGISPNLGGTGDPSPMTAYGVFIGIKSAAKHVFGTDSLANKRILVQGMGHVGAVLVDRLIQEKAQVLICDISAKRLEAVSAKHPSVEVVAPEAFLSTEVDIFAPCALGGVLNAQSIPRLRCAIVAGAANNQLRDEVQDATLLKERNIVYAPDFLVNAGGIIAIYYEYLQAVKPVEAGMAHIEGIYAQLQDVLHYAEAENISTNQAAMQLASARIAAVKQVPNLRNTE